LHVRYNELKIMYSQHRSCNFQVKKKAEALKDNRDYSFLLSDDADLSSSPKEKPAARSSLTQRAGELEL
jgi:hypothetical protein